MLITTAGYRAVLGGKYTDTNQAALQCGRSVWKTELLIIECLGLGKLCNEEIVGYFF